jgi:ArsR family transcriptional regulator
MKTSTPKSAPDSINHVLGAFSDPTRLRILHLLLRGEVCVGDLVKILRISQPRVSRHLASLRRARLVEVRKSGLWCLYSLSPAKSKFHQHLLECVASACDEVAAIEADDARATRILKSGGCCPEE